VCSRLLLVGWGKKKKRMRPRGKRRSSRPNHWNKGGEGEGAGTLLPRELWGEKEV